MNLKMAVMQSMPPDKGLYMPLSLNTLSPHVVDSLLEKPFEEIAYHIASHLIGDAIPSTDLKDMIHRAITFPAPVVRLDDRLSVLELWHGPSLAFKDFGARFMAQLMAYFQAGAGQKSTILVATSGDTGGAVAAGFHCTPGVEVVILYPKGRVSTLQEWQLTRLGDNIHACEIAGDFDDCQRIVKQAFLDHDLNRQYALSSANSINIARLIPQTFYYAEALKQVNHRENVVFCVPSGNLGNLTAGLITKHIGLPIHRFIAVTNVNHVFPDYLNTGIFAPRSSTPTISNAMDVSNPSNFARIASLYGNNVEMVRKDIQGYWYNDFTTLKALQHAFDYHNYVCDTHGALGYWAALEYLSKNPQDHVVFLETAHPSKFANQIENQLKITIPIPDQILTLLQKLEQKKALNNDFWNLKIICCQGFKLFFESHDIVNVESPFRSINVMTTKSIPWSQS